MCVCVCVESSQQYSVYEKHVRFWVEAHVKNERRGPYPSLSTYRYLVLLLIWIQQAITISLANHINSKHSYV